MAKRVEMRVGEVWNRWTVVAVGGKNAHGSKLCICRCSCPNRTEKILIQANVRCGQPKSCGCLLTESNVQRAKHGLCGTRVYRIWKGIHSRCNNPKEPAYPRYGGRGIKVCERWRDPTVFVADMGIPLPNMSLDRIDVNGDYSPQNCRWATAKEQQRNTRKNVWLEAFGKRQVLAAWSEQLGISCSTIRRRMKNGWTAEEALSTPLYQHPPRIK